MIHDNESLKAAWRRSYSIPIYDDGYGPLWVLRDSLGICGIARARTWEDAYSIAEDKFFPEACETLDELRAEYGFKREYVKIVLGPLGEREARYPEDYLNGVLALPFVRWKTRETPDPDAWSDNECFQEAFGFRPNGPNTTDKLNHGIYAHDLNGESLDRLTPELAGHLEIRIEKEAAS